VTSANPLIDRLLSHAADSPSRPFLEESAGRLAYGEARQRIAEAAERLARLARGRPVLLQGPNGIDWMVQFLAAQAAGLPVVCLPEQTRGEQAERLARLLGSAFHLGTGLDGGVTLGGTGRRPEIPPLAAFCLPTSGTTGEPRLVLRSAASLLAEGERYARLLGLGPEDSVLAAIPICHAFCLGLAVGGTIAAGGTLRLRAVFSPRSLQRELRRAPPSVLPLVPSAARLLAVAWGAAAAPGETLRHVVVGAGPVTEELEARILDCLGRRPARNYGSSETGSTLGTAGQEVLPGVTGLPLPDVEAAIVHGGCGGPGALFVRMASAFLGYLTEDGVDARRTSPDGWYSTGDLATRDASGAIRVVGRMGHGLRRGGRTIQPMEVESALRRHPAVSDAVVTGGADDQGEEVIEAHVELQPGAQADVAELRRHLEGTLETYKIPGQWRLYRTLPRTSGGKPDRPRLQRAAAHKDRGGGLFATLACHRLSAAVAVAHKVGVLAALAEGGLRLPESADRLGLDREGVELLLSVLAAAGLVSRGNDGEHRLIDGDWSSGFGEVVELESCLRRGQLSEEAIERLIREGVPRDTPASDAGFGDLYRRVMGRGARGIALHAWRRVALPPGPIADVGRPGGSFAAVATRREPEREVTVLDVPLATPGELQLPPGSLAGLFVHNVFRYLCRLDQRAGVESLVRSLRPGGVLIISDIFVDAPAPDPWLRPALALDWAAFGSIAWSRGEDLCAELRDLGLDRLERFQPDRMIEVILASRATNREVPSDARDQESSSRNFRPGAAPQDQARGGGRHRSGGGARHRLDQLPGGPDLGRGRIQCDDRGR
jgi:acyl-CoA synthetase (AMP-forming)/AMP-acid ligase II/SAM-dependent methyltransferase